MTINMDLLVKWFWRIIFDVSCLWHVVVLSRYGNRNRMIGETIIFCSLPVDVVIYYSGQGSERYGGGWTENCRFTATGMYYVMSIGGYSPS